MCNLKEGCRSSSENSVQSICFVVGCRCRMLKALLRMLKALLIFLHTTRGHMYRHLHQAGLQDLHLGGG